MSLTEEQINTLHEVVSQFRGLQDTLPTQLQEIRETLAIQQQQINTLVNSTLQPNQAMNIKVRLPTTFDGKPGQCSTFFSQLSTNVTNAFGDSDPVITAENQLRRLKQDNLSASIYATRFRMHAQLVEWNDAALMSQFKVNLSQPIQNELARRPNCTTLEQLIFEAIYHGWLGDLKI
ncbi:hypothetical protein [Parasitella parasitica]|uniref:Retrotransposon gag domain-containing protein n=1 Tax=Parasitella parasitica TaxID=35722 RepID=A0A0B7N703_9FUNG|nr:hypothetical protein [Parasitella parasitica]